MIDNAYNYLIGRTNSIATSYSETFDPDSPIIAAVYRCVGGTTSKSIARNRQYVRYSFNVLVRGEQDSSELVNICDSMIDALDMDSTGVIMCLVTSEPQYSYTDDNGNLNYTFNVDVLL